MKRTEEVLSREGKENMKNSNRTYRFRLAAGIVLSAAVVFCGCSQRGDVVLIDATDTVESVTAEESSEIPEAQALPERATLWVHVCGAVVQEGVYELPAGSRCVDAVEAAGGFAEEADRSALNLALPVSDGEQIRVLTQEEAATGQAMSEVVSDSRVNINTAGKDELMTLPGIGASRADAILEYREQHGGFENIEEIMQVPGIKEHSFEKLRENIKVGIENGEQGFSSG